MNNFQIHRNSENKQKKENNTIKIGRNLFFSIFLFFINNAPKYVMK